MKATRSLETGKKSGAETIEPRRLRQRLVTPHPDRLMYLRYAFENGMSVTRRSPLYGHGSWFLHGMKQIGDEIRTLTGVALQDASEDDLRTAKRMGISDERLAAALTTGVSETQIPFGE